MIKSNTFDVNKWLIGLLTSIIIILVLAMNFGNSADIKEMNKKIHDIDKSVVQIKTHLGLD